MSEKICEYTKSSFGFFGWRGDKHPADVCVMAIALNQPVTSADLLRLNTSKRITDVEFQAIKHFDARDATKDDLETIKALAKRFKVELVEYNENS